jgi:hypothetical protein
MPAKSERIRLSYLTNSRIAASSPPSVSGYIADAGDHHQSLAAFVLTGQRLDLVG